MVGRKKPYGVGDVGTYGQGSPVEDQNSGVRGLKTVEGESVPGGGELAELTAWILPVR
jgi:hypothetical protein